MKMKIAAILTAATLIAVPSAFARPRWGGPPPGRCYYGGYYGCGPRYSLAGDIVRLVGAGVGLTMDVLGAPRYVVSSPAVYYPAPAAVVPVTPAPRPAAVTVIPAPQPAVVPVVPAAPAPVVYYQQVPAGYTVQYSRPVYVRTWGY